MAGAPPRMKTTKMEMVRKDLVLLCFEVSSMFIGAQLVSVVLGGWGTSANSNSAWGSTATEKQEDTSGDAVQPKQEPLHTNPVAVKREAARSEMEADDGDAAETPVWFMERVCVQLKNNGSSAVIKEVTSDSTALVEMEDKSSKTVRVGDVSMLPPKEHDMVLVTGGADVGVEGELVCIDGTDAILKDSNEDFKIVDFVCLAKIVGDS